MIKAIKLKSIIVSIIAVVICALLSYGIVSVSAREVPKSIYTIVIDAGHGGRDDGCSGTLDTKESVLNLAIAKKLKTYMEDIGFKVVMTRSDSNGLYDANASNYKQSDMEKRVDIIKKANADMVISIHQNSFADSSQCGSQCFYQENDERSKAFAESMQDQLNKHLPNARGECLAGDYYLLKESPASAIIVECGYLTNLEEEKKLTTDEYQSKVAYTILCGVIQYFELCGND